MPGMKFTLRQLLAWIGVLCVEMALAAPHVNGNDSDTGRSLFLLSVMLPCTIAGGFLGVSIGRKRKDQVLGVFLAIVFAIFGFIFGFFATVFINVFILR